MANSVNPGQTALSGAVWSGSELFAYTILSEALVYEILRQEEKLIHFVTVYLHLIICSWSPVSILPPIGCQHSRGIMISH